MTNYLLSKMRCLHRNTDGLPFDTEICPSCNVHIPSLMRDVMPPGTRLPAETYQIDYALGRGGFGVTYRAHHTLLEQLVAIKEYFPQSCALRNPTTGGFTIPRNQEDIFQRGKKRFLKEGKILSRLECPTNQPIRYQKIHCPTNQPIRYIRYKIRCQKIFITHRQPIRYIR